MTRYFTLLFAAYGLVVIETSLRSESGLVTPYGSFVWMLLPWLATHPSRSASVVAAAIYGLMIDAVSNHPPGLLIAATIVVTSVLQKVITPKSLETPSRIFVVNFVCGCLMAMLAATRSVFFEASPVTPSTLVGAIAFSSAIAAGFTTLAAGLLRGCGTLLTTNQSPAH